MADDAKREVVQDYDWIRGGPAPHWPWPEVTNIKQLKAKLKEEQLEIYQFMDSQYYRRHLEDMPWLKELKKEG